MNSFWNKIVLGTQHLIIITTRLVLLMFSRFNVRGLDNIKKLPKGIVFAGPHRSEMDPVFMPSALLFTKHMPIYFVVMKSGNYDNLGWRGRKLYGGDRLFFQILGGYTALTGRSLDYDTKLKNHIKLINNGNNVCLFPEGRISNHGSRNPVRPGIAHLVYRTKCPVVPFAIHGINEFSWKKVLLGKARITVEFGKPIFPEEILPSNIEVSSSKNDYKLISERIMDRVNNLIGAEERRINLDNRAETGISSENAVCIK